MPTTPFFSIGIQWDIQSGGSSENGGGFDPVWGGTDLSQQNSGVARTDLVLGQVAAPAAPTLTDMGAASGVIIAGTYQVKISYYNEITKAALETDASTATSITILANHAIKVTSPGAVEGATHYKVYFTSSGGATFFNQTPVGIAIGTDYTQSTGVSTSGATPNTVNYLQYFTSPGNPFTSADVGNVMKVTSGAGFTLQRVEAKDFTSASSRLYCAANSSNNLGTSGSTGGTGNLGGRLSLPTDVNAFKPGAGNTIHIQGPTTYNITGRILGGCDNASENLPVTWVSYQTVHGDYGARATIKATGGSSFTMFDMPLQPHMVLDSLIIDGNNRSKITGIASNGYPGAVIKHCWILNCTANAIWHDTAANIFDCEFSGCSIDNSITDSSVCTLRGGCIVRNCYFHDNTVRVIFGSVCSILDSIFDHNTGSSTDAIQAQSVNDLLYVENCDINDSGRHGIYIPLNNTAVASIARNYWFANNIITNSGTSGTGWGLTTDNFVDLGEISVGLPKSYVYNNAFYNNASGNFDSSKFPNNVDNVILTGMPYVDKNSGDWRLNASVGEGIECIGTGYNNVFPSSALALSVSYPDIGAVKTLGSPAGVGNTIAFVGGG